jgi:hypothetical protein
MNSQSSPSVAKAFEVTDAFMATFNAHDWKAHFETLNFPHIRIASGAVQVWNTPEHLKEYESHWTGRIEPDWSYSAWNSREVIHSSDDKAHLAVQFTRYDKSGTKIATYQATYIITYINGHWGIQARTSFAP